MSAKSVCSIFAAEIKSGWAPALESLARTCDVRPHIAFSLLMVRALVAAEELPHLEVSANGHYLQYADGRPFFYLGDTAWELFHRLDREEADRYLKNRSEKGYNVIQAVALAELDGVDVANAYGHKPLVNQNPAHPDTKEGEDNDYWDHVDYIVQKANEEGMYVGLLPTWGRYWNDGNRPIFNEENAECYIRRVKHLALGLCRRLCEPSYNLGVFNAIVIGGERVVIIPPPLRLLRFTAPFGDSFGELKFSSSQPMLLSHRRPPVSEGQFFQLPLPRTGLYLLTEQKLAELQKNNIAGVQSHR